MVPRGHHHGRSQGKRPSVPALLCHRAAHGGEEPGTPRVLLWREVGDQRPGSLPATSPGGGHAPSSSSWCSGAGVWG